MQGVKAIRLTVDSEVYRITKKVLIDDTTDYATAFFMFAWFAAIGILTIFVVGCIGSIDAGYLEGTVGGVMLLNPGIEVFIHCCFIMYRICVYLLLAWFIAVFSLQPAMEYYYRRKDTL